MSVGQNQRGLSAAAVHPLPLLNSPAVDDDFDDLEWLDSVVGSARVVAVGESAHFNAESYRLRHRIFRYLVHRHGFTGYLMESGFVEGRRVNRWVHGSIGTTEIGDVLANGMTSLMGMNVEFHDQLDWMRTYNAARGTQAGTTGQRQLSFYGIDPPGSNLSLLPGLDLVIDFLTHADPPFTVNPRLREIAAAFAANSNFEAPHAFAAYSELSRPVKDELTAGLASLLARLQTERPRYVAQTTVEEYETALHAMRLTVAEDLATRDLSEGAAAGRGPSVNIRDLGQADTVDWVLQREDRVLLAAHNSHIQRYPIEFPGVFGPITSAGQILGDRLGDEYTAIATTQGGGQTLAMGESFYRGDLFTALEPPQPGTLDGLMAAAHDGPFGVDLGRIATHDRDTLTAVRQQRSGPFSCPIDPLVAFDAIIHLPWVTPATVDDSAVASATPEVQKVFRSWQAKSRSEPALPSTG